MIYFDELEHNGKTGGIDKILENCNWDIEYGYRQLKIKIGRSGKWYSHEEGLKMDIEVIKKINIAFPDVTLLVDSNDKYTLQDTIDFLKKELETFHYFGSKNLSGRIMKKVKN